MKLVVDMGESSLWVDRQEDWPDWLDEAWLHQHDAYLICRLTDCDTPKALRAIVPDGDRLMCLPHTPVLQASLSTAELHQINQLFARYQGAGHYIRLKPGQTAPLENDFENIADINPNDEPTAQLTLAMVTPLPPTTSGIATYCAELLPDLAAQYRIVLVVADPNLLEPAIRHQYRTISHADFLSTAEAFDRILYHFGNSQLHYDYFTLIKAKPGVAVLHDIFLGDCLFSNFPAMHTTQLFQQIYYSHGWSALPACKGEVKDVIARFPACAQAIEDSYGVIVHNQSAIENLKHHFSDDTLGSVRHTPLAQRCKNLPDKTSARKILGLAADSAVFASFGFINYNKCVFEILEAWKLSDLSSSNSARLVFVGNCDDPHLMKKFARRVRALGLEEQVSITGYVDDEEYECYLAAADIALQLRRSSRGESSAAVLDCLAAGLTTIVSAHGSMAEFPDSIAAKLPEPFTSAQLANKLTEALSAVRSDPSSGQEAKDYVTRHHSPEHAVRSYVSHIEDIYSKSTDYQSDLVYQHTIVPMAGKLPSHTIWSMTHEFEELLACAGARPKAPWGKQLLLDITPMVTRAWNDTQEEFWDQLLLALLHEDHPPYRIEPVYFDEGAHQFRYARAYVNHLLQLAPLEIYDDIVDIRTNDAYVDLNALATAEPDQSRLACVANWRARCVAVYSCIGLGPEGTSEYQTPNSPEDASQAQLPATALISDGIICPGGATIEQYRRCVGGNFEATDSSWPRLVCLDPDDAPGATNHNTMVTRASDQSAESIARQLIEAIVRDNVEAGTIVAPHTDDGLAQETVRR